MKSSYLLRLAQDFQRLASDEPHRVICVVDGEREEHIFPTKAEAVSFARSCKQLVAIQPASELPYEFPKEEIKVEQPERDFCRCGNWKLVSDEECDKCKIFPNR